MHASDELSHIVGPDEVARKLKLGYSRGVKDQTEKILDELINISAQVDKPEISLKDILLQSSDLITRRLGIARVAVGLRNPSDGLYRYETVVGLPNEIVAEFAKIVYNRDQLLDSSTYKNYDISRYSRIFLGEDHPYAPGEEISYLRPGLLEMKRRSAADALEADYIDTFFYDSKGDILGWIELSGTRTKKIPDATCVKWTELISFLLVAAIRFRSPEQV